MRENDDIGISVSAALGGAFMLSLMNMLSKLMAPFFSPVDIVFWRNAFALVFLLPFIFATGRTVLLKTARWKAQLWRAFVGTTGFTLFVWAFSLLSLSEVVAIGFTAPLFVVILSPLYLKEAVGWRRIVATAVGFLGVLFFTGLDGGGISSVLGFWLALGAAFCNAQVMLSLRFLGDTEHSITTNVYFMAFGLLGVGLFMPAYGTMPSVNTLWFLPAIGFVGLLSLLLKTEAYRRGAAALVAPLSYTLMIWALLLDWVIWDKAPTWQTLAGSGVIIGSNIFIIYREYNLHKEASCLKP